jgi:hypothetical protein
MEFLETANGAAGRVNKIRPVVENTVSGEMLKPASIPARLGSTGLTARVLRTPGPGRERLLSRIGTLKPRRVDGIKRALGFSLDWPELKGV